MNKAANCALILIALALAGAGVSYHFTLESRFSALEQKLDQNAVALQQCEIAQETVASSKTDALNSLSKEVDDLQASLEPLGKTTQEQNAALAEIRKQVAALQQSQATQQDTQKKLTDYAGQLEQIKHDVAVQVVKSPASQPAPAVVAAPVLLPKPAPVAPMAVTPEPVPAPAAATPAPVAYPVALPVALPVAPRASAVGTPPPLAPRADNAVDIRPDESVRTADVSIRAFPVAEPVVLSQNR